MKEENEDIVIEDDPDLIASAETEKKLRERLNKTEAKAKEYLDGWQRAQADFVNLRKRDEEAKTEFIKFANESFLLELIPVLDSFDLALSHASTSSAQVADIEPVHKQFLSVLKSHGLEVLEPMGETFDPRWHESVGIVEVKDNSQDHKILEIIQKGYILSGKIIRPAKVKIGEYHG